MPVINVRLSDEDVERLKRCQEALQRRYDRESLGVVATQRTTLSAALQELEKRIRDWERKR